ncbi:phosphatidylinositol N-acetylglucosaminyltransferase subunit GPI1 [Sitophilus oryzae]|uniref:Phosphatidylinositol N-acetylglucosaminyltransferase subunit GPI1 n=1 Tax=Sitophilus oryzae TaxID=7048 RepID=A0A6J2X378_SITOR|nr:phosphatidylinositol N-acetylglucosaminyltransferase subunit GPI1 [Sitophilus oryzae]XP_030745385.1 phosphatidylinositol N-acetylglucosaminyltransferase subunit GPI1 [Sitophilus oryzae]
MNRNTLILIPNSLSTNKTGFIEGLYRDYGCLKVYYITSDEVKDKSKDVIGYCSQILTPNLFFENTILFEYGTNKIHLNDKETNFHQITELVYDYAVFKSTNITFSEKKYGIHIKQLSEGISKSSNINQSILKQQFVKVLSCISFITSFLLLIFSKFFPIINNSAILSYTYTSCRNIDEFVNILRNQEVISLKIYNKIVAKIIDIILGCAFIYFCLKYKYAIVTKFEQITEDLVSLLRNLLIYLMGSPIGLKLNYAFNHSLARFFFYHINLWRVFLEAIQPHLEANFKILLIPGIFGISYQIALLCDIISVTTFHIYCIYVYAARLFHLQIRGLSTLWRLFIGRKFNPLRGRVDSCEYSSNQLFIGTLAFTILLFLLPTTTLYYTVFVTFRLVTVIVIGVLKRVTKLISNIPLYLTLLWVFGCPSMAGSVLVSYKHSTGSKNMRADLKLVSPPLLECIRAFSFNDKHHSESSLTPNFYHIFIGKLI